MSEDRIVLFIYEGVDYEIDMAADTADIFAQLDDMPPLAASKFCRENGLDLAAVSYAMNDFKNTVGKIARESLDDVFSNKAQRPPALICVTPSVRHSRLGRWWSRIWRNTEADTDQ